MIKIGICDDEQSQIEYLSRLVNTWANQSQNVVGLKSFCSSENFLFHYEEDKDFDILLLDIEMRKTNGVALARQLRKDNESVQIIFITGFADYISQGYDVSALHYLMKPVNEEKLFEVLSKAIIKLSKNEKSIFVTIDNENIRIKASDVLYCESFAHNCVMITPQKQYTVKIPFTELEQLLGKEFVRSHRSYIVGIRHIKSITRTDVVLDDTKRIPLSRRMYHDVNQAFINYFKGDM